MAATHIYAFVLLGVSFQQTKSESKIVAVHQTVKENKELENLKAFVRRGDPCAELPLISTDHAKADKDKECARAVKGFVQLPRGARKRCLRPVTDHSGCRLADPTRNRNRQWYCGLVHSKSKVEASLSYCVENLDLYCSNKWLQRGLQHPLITEPLETGKIVEVVPPQLEEKENYLKQLKIFAGGHGLSSGEQNDSTATAVVGLDPCARLGYLPNAAAITEADRQCKAAIDDFKSLPTEAKDRCQNEVMQNEGCKRLPHPWKKWCCGVDLQVKRTGLAACFRPQIKTGSVCFLHCLDGLEIRILS